VAVSFFLSLVKAGMYGMLIGMAKACKCSGYVWKMESVDLHTLGRVP
jgi:hypothetical protein